MPLKILIVCRQKKGVINSFIEEQVNSLRSLDTEADYFFITRGGLQGYDIIHAHYGLSGLLATLQFSKPVIVTFHGSDINTFGIRFLSRLAYQFCRHAIFVTDQLQTRLNAKHKSSVIACGVDLDIFYPMDMQEARVVMGLAPEKRYALFSSSFDNEVKNSPLAIAACEKVETLELLELKNFERKQVNYLLNACNFLLLTSFNEGSPQVVKEAMAANCPIISVNVGGVSQLLSKVDNTFITSFSYTQIVRTIRHLLSLNRRSEGRNKIIETKLDLESIATRLQTLYQHQLKPSKERLRTSYLDNLNHRDNQSIKNKNQPIEFTTLNLQERNGYLGRAMNVLFKPYQDGGFWNEAEGRIIERLSFNNLWKWFYDPSENMRYLAFCLSNLLLAKFMNGLDTTDYDKQIITSINYLNENNTQLTVSDLTYGALSSLLLGKRLYPELNIDIELIELLFDKSLTGALNRYDNQDALILIAGKFLQDVKPNASRLSRLKLLTDRYLKAENGKGFFETGDLRGIYHQRNMYVLWGLGFASEFYPEKQEKIKLTIANIIRFIWANNRRKEDNAFLWHPPYYTIRNRFGFMTPVYNRESSKFLFECHQTFFANSITIYQKQFKTTEFETEKTAAMGWIFGKNYIGKNLVDLTLKDVPARILNLDGELFIKNQQFKGIYEIGSYILALSDFNYFTSAK
jgi:teichuronic acid biosynthesis glycosyltransferase TuaC